MVKKSEISTELMIKIILYGALTLAVLAIIIMAGQYIIKVVS